MKLMIEKFRFPLLCLCAALVTLLGACGSSSTQSPPQGGPAPQSMDADALPTEAASVLSAPAAPPATGAPAASQSSAPVEAPPAAVQQEAALTVPAITPTFNRRAAMEQGAVVLSGRRSVPCLNAQELLSFYEDYRAGREASVSIYSFRTQNDDETLYALYTLTQSGGTTQMTEDTAHYYDAARYPEQANEAGVSLLGTFSMAKNRYGFLTVDVEGESGLLQFHYQVTGYDELYPSIQKYAEEYKRYLAPLAGTGILEFFWDDPAQLLEAGVFPDAFEPIAGEALAGKRDSYWSEEEKSYRFPQEAVEQAVLPRFGLSAEQLRSLAAYNAENTAYSYVPRTNSGLTDLRILKVTQPEAGASAFAAGTDESLLEIRYEFYSPEDGAPAKRGKLTVLLTAEDDFRFLGNELLPDPVTEESSEA